LIDRINKKIIYSVIGVIIVIGISIFFLQQFEFPSIPKLDFKPEFNQGALSEARQLEISLNNLSFTRINNNDINIKTAFNVYNPNMGTLLLENINYNILLDNIRISSGDIGKKPEGFVASQENIYPIIGNSTVILKDDKTILKDNRIVEVWNKILDEKSKFQINGNFAYKQTSSFQATAGEIDFQLNYP